MRASENWAADGGKSKSHFWKTTDGRFIVKTLVDAWNVADLQVLLELGPSYFRYMDNTVSAPTALAKLLGFYTVEVRNLESGNTVSRADLLVMENLFFDRKIVKTFDLKGIPGRKVKAKGGKEENKTLFDGEWMEGWFTWELLPEENIWLTS
jgi:1-phosphatidylinositol-3-phosphate 5-kinase